MTTLRCTHGNSYLLPATTAATHKSAQSCLMTSRRHYTELKLPVHREVVTINGIRQHCTKTDNEPPKSKGKQRCTDKYSKLPNNKGQYNATPTGIAKEPHFNFIKDKKNALRFQFLMDAESQKLQDGYKQPLQWSWFLQPHTFAVHHWDTDNLYHAN